MDQWAEGEGGLAGEDRESRLRMKEGKDQTAGQGPPGFCGESTVRAGRWLSADGER